jgi:6-pyruvoyltetrahydropterin/6-carboxytetrahydropterin synthase
MHGHSYRLEVAVGGPLQTDGPASGMVVDFDDIKRVVRRLAIEELDHRTLNDVLDNPTAERIVLWIWDRLEPELPGLEELVLWETANSCAVLRKSER